MVSMGQNICEIFNISENDPDSSIIDSGNGSPSKLESLECRPVLGPGVGIPWELVTDTLVPSLVVGVVSDVVDPVLGATVDVEEDLQSKPAAIVAIALRLDCN